MLIFRSFGGICETASCPVRDLSSLRVGNPRVGVSVSCAVTVQTVLASSQVTSWTHARVHLGFSDLPTPVDNISVPAQRLVLKATGRRDRQRDTCRSICHGPLSRRCLRATETRRDTGPWRCSSDGTDDETRLIVRRYVVRRHVFNLKLRFVHHYIYCNVCNRIACSRPIPSSVQSPVSSPCDGRRLADPRAAKCPVVCPVVPSLFRPTPCTICIASLVVWQPRHTANMSSNG